MDYQTKRNSKTDARYANHSGFCSREQNYRPEDCAICHSALTGKAGSGFWEGGKGTRDKVRMSRKGEGFWLSFSFLLLLWRWV